MSGVGDGAVTVVLADAQPTARDAARRRLERAGMAVLAEAGNADDAIATVLREDPDLCVIDVLLPGDAVAAMERITAERPATAIVVVTESRERDHLFDSVRAGAAGYLLKDMDPDRLPHALHGVLAGEAAIPRTLVAALISELRSRGRRQLVVGSRGRVQLTAREWDVAELLVEGLPTAEIAARLAIAPVTVRRHISELMRKLRVRDRASAVRLLAERRAG